MNALLQNVQRLIEEAQRDLEAARREIEPATESREDLTLRAALSHLSSAHVCVAGTLHRAGIAARAKGTEPSPAVFGTVPGVSEG